MCGVGLVADVRGGSGRLVLPLALRALGRLAHRGAIDADGRTGDGAGVMIDIPRAILGAAPADAAGLVFLPRDESAAQVARRLLATSLAAHGLVIDRWRPVPIDESALGQKARLCRPAIEQIIVTRPAQLGGEELERRLFEARKETERRADSHRLDDFYIASLSHRTIVYKALVRALDLAAFYPDLTHPELETSFALFHQRFSTNTLPSWSMTQPFRLLAHNGEINTISGNRQWMRARGFDLASGVSDSASLDEALSILTAGGREIAQGMTMLIPPAWEHDSGLDEATRAMFEYQSLQVEPWDGPALVVFSDGEFAGAALDRNGLRPARFAVTIDGLVLVASEAGVLDVEEHRIIRRGRLGPGEIVAVDLVAGEFHETKAIRSALAAKHPYRQWLNGSARAAQ